MKVFCLSLLLTIIASSAAFSSTLIKCVVPNPRNVLLLEIDNTNLAGTLTELNGSPVAIESADGRTFVGADFFGSITLAPGALSSLSGRTHAVLTTPNGKQVLNCMKRTSVSLEALIETPAPATGFEECRVPRIDLGNPHRNYDAKFRACRAKAVSIGKVGEELRRCQAICMKV